MNLFMKLIVPAYLLVFITCCSGVNSDQVKNAGSQTAQDVKPGDTLRGRAVNIIDGDTYDLLVSKNKMVRIRCFGIDAPERGQDFYVAARRRLGIELMGDNLMVVLMDRAGGRRMAGKTYNRGRRVETEVVKMGMAWHFKRYSQEAELAAAEQKARDQKIGIWSMPDPVAPWEWRKKRRQN